jgi:tRNA1Val (adenine37-N6)-methyltransferase
MNNTTGFFLELKYDNLSYYFRMKMKPASAITDFLKGRIQVRQGISGYRFSVDAVLLASFIDEPKDHRIIDLGTGCGIIPLILAAEKGYSEITGVEIQKQLAEYAGENISANELEKKIKILHADFRSFIENPPGKPFDAAVANPPYKKPGTGKINPSTEKAIARHEITCSLSELIRSAAAATKKRSALYMIYHPFRFDESITELQKNGYHVERFRAVHPRPGEAASLFLLKAVKRSTRETVIENPIIIYDKNSRYSAYMRRILALN